MQLGPRHNIRNFHWLLCHFRVANPKGYIFDIDSFTTVPTYDNFNGSAATFCISNSSSHACDGNKLFNRLALV